MNEKINEEATIASVSHSQQMLRVEIESENGLSKRWLRFYCDGPIYGAPGLFNP